MAANTILEIERAIGTLSPKELEDLYQWLDKNHPAPIDERLPSDISSGRLDSVILRALEGESSGQIRPL